MTVRSRRLFGPTANGAAATWELLYEVPAGRTARFDIHLYNSNAAATDMVVGIGPTGSVLGFGRRPVPALSSSEIIDVCLNPGDKLWGRTAGGAGSCHFTGFGSLLLGAPT